MLLFIKGKYCISPGLYEMTDLTGQKKLILGAEGKYTEIQMTT